MMASWLHLLLLLGLIYSIHCTRGSIERRHRQRQAAALRARGDGENTNTCDSVLCPHGTQCVNKEIQCRYEACPTVAVCEATKSFPNFCGQDMDVGTCGTNLESHTQERWFYNQTAAQCQVFQYSGCGGNENKYLTSEHCERSCVRLEECYLKPETGPCRARFIRYSYDVLDGICKTFVYGGCRGNGNNFVTFDACMQKCYISEFENPDFNRPYLPDE